MLTILSSQPKRLVKQTNDALGQRLTKAEEQNQQLQSDLKVVTNKLKLTQGELIAAASRPNPRPCVREEA